MTVPRLARYLNPAWERTHGYRVDEMLGRPFSDFQRPEVFARDIHEFARHLSGGSVKEYETTHIAKDGRELTLLFSAIPLCNAAGEVVGTQGTAIDITERKEASSLNESLLKTIPFPMDIVDTQGRVLFLNGPLDQVLGRNAEGERCWTLYRDDKTQCGDCPLKRSLEFGTTAVIESSGVFGGRTFEILHTPMKYKGQDAMLEVFLDISERKRTEEQTLERNKELRELYASLQTVREAERYRLARELHDDLGQRVTALRMDLDWMESKMTPTSAQVSTKMASVNGQIDELADSIRHLTEDMRPGMLDTLGLTVAVEDYLVKFSARTGINCEFDTLEGELKVPDEVAIGIFRIVQEALNNTQKYAKASRVSVLLRQTDHAIRFKIDDDGLGFPDTASEVRKGFGLRGMQERVSNSVYRTP